MAALLFPQVANENKGGWFKYLPIGSMNLDNNNSNNDDKEGSRGTTTGASPVMESRPAVRSCTTCSKAKAKCVRQPGRDICERCARLRKECHMREPVMRKRKAVKTSRAAQLEQLEHKIQHLVDALATSQTFQGQPSPPLSTVGDASVSGHPRRSIDNHRRSDARERPVNLLSEMQDVCADFDACEQAVMSAQHSSGPSPSSAVTMRSEQGAARWYLGVSIAEADVLLDRFRRLMAPSFPFVVIPATATAQQLYEEKPFLLHVLVVVTYFHDLPKQQSMVKDIMRDVSERMLINGEKSLSILQGLLVFASWYHPHMFWAQQGNNLLHLAISLALDLGIDRPPGGVHGELKAVGGKNMSNGCPSNRVGTSDDWRALAGLFYITSTLASAFKHMYAFPWSEYLEENLKKLEQAQEYESDVLLVQMVRIQRLAEEVHTTEAPTSGPVNVYRKAFDADLCKLKETIPPTVSNNVYLRLQQYYVAILILEAPVMAIPENRSSTFRSHLDDIYRLVDAVNRYKAVFFTIPASQYLLVPFSAMAQFAHTFIVLTRLVSLDIEGWDFKTAHESLDYLGFIEEAATRYEASTRSSLDGMRINNDSFGKWAQKLRWMKQMYETKYVRAVSAATAASHMSSATPAEPSDGLGSLNAIQEEHAAAGYGVQQLPVPQPQQQQPQQPTPPDDFPYTDFVMDDGIWSSFLTEFDPLQYPDFGDVSRMSNVLNP